MIEVKNLTKEFKIAKKYDGPFGTLRSFFSTEYVTKRAVDDISFTIETGEVVGYIGLNGAGKSTTIKMLTGLMRPTDGECVVNGMVPYKERKKYTKQIGVVFGNRSQLWWDLPVIDSFRVLQKIYEVPKEEFEERLQFLIDTFGVQEFLLTPVRSLSLGQKMRADLIASLLHNPDLLFLDEPTIGLDVLVKDKIRKALKEINETLHTTILLTTHDLDDIEQLCKRIIVIDKGRKIFDGDIDELKNKFSKSRVVEIETGSAEFDVKQIESPYIHGEATEDGRYRIEFDKQQVSLPSLMEELVTNYDIKDFTVIESELEDIVKEIYK